MRALHSLAIQKGALTGQTIESYVKKFGNDQELFEGIFLLLNVHMKFRIPQLNNPPKRLFEIEYLEYLLSTKDEVFAFERLTAEGDSILIFQQNSGIYESFGIYFDNAPDESELENGKIFLARMEKFEQLKQNSEPDSLSQIVSFFTKQDIKRRFLRKWIDYFVAIIGEFLTKDEKEELSDENKEKLANLFKQFIGFSEHQLSRGVNNLKTLNLLKEYQRRILV